MKTYWKKWRETQGDGWHNNYSTFYKQLYNAETNEPIEEPIKITYAEFERML